MGLVMKNIVFVITKSEIGGAQSWVYEVAKVLSTSPDCTTISLITSDHGWLTECSIFDFVEIIPEIQKKFSINAILKIRKFLSKIDADIVISSSANAGFYSRLTKLIYKHYSIYVSHGWSCIYNGGRMSALYCTIETMLSKITDKIVCVSQSDKHKALKILGISESKLEVVINTITPMEARDSQLPPSGKVLFLGRLTPPKRPELIAEVISQQREFTLDIVGDGSYFSTLKEKYGKYDNIHFLGEIKGFNNFSDYDVFSLVSDSEGLPVSAIEAHTAGLPLILSDVGGCSELISNNGLLVDNSINSISNAIGTIFDDYNVFLKNAQKCKTKFNIEQHKQLYIDTFLDN